MTVVSLYDYELIMIQCFICFGTLFNIPSGDFLVDDSEAPTGRRNFSLPAAVTVSLLGSQPGWLFTFSFQQVIKEILISRSMLGNAFSSSSSSSSLLHLPSPHSNCSRITPPHSHSQSSLPPLVSLLWGMSWVYLDGSLEEDKRCGCRLGLTEQG